MIRAHFNTSTWLLFVAVILFSAASAHAQSNERPNVLFIFLDDFGWRDCGFMGSDFYETPNLDRLAGEGMVFTNAYASASNCAPSRACLLSGQYTPRHQVFNVGTKLRGNPKYSRLQHVPGTDVLSPKIKTWAHLVQEAGYRTATIGKWHLSDDPIPYGFNFNFAGSHSGSPPKGYFPPHPNVPGLKGAAKDEYLTDRLNDEAIKFIERNRERPWFLYLTHFAVHTPLQAKKDVVERYQEKPQGELHRHAVMAAMIESVDQGVGRIVAKLDELGLTEKTAIVFTSDNGGYGPATSMKPLRGYKGTYYEGGIREPFFVKWPGQVAAGKKCDTPIINVDLLPTFCEMTGANLPADQPIDGVSLMPIWRGERIEERGIYWHFPAYLQGRNNSGQQRDPLFRSRPCGIIRVGNWKLHQYFEDGGLELYNLIEDPGEKKNLASTHVSKRNELLEKLKQWREKTAAPVPTKQNPRFDAAEEQAAIEKNSSMKRSSKKE